MKSCKLLAVAVMVAHKMNPYQKVITTVRYFVVRTDISLQAASDGVRSDTAEAIAAENNDSDEEWARNTVHSLFIYSHNPIGWQSDIKGNSPYCVRLFSHRIRCKANDLLQGKLNNCLPVNLTQYT